MSEFRKSRAFRPLVIIGSILLAVLIFIATFYVPASKAEVVGNTRYTATEIRKMVLNKFINHNSLYLSHFKKTVVPEDAPFVESIDIEYQGHNRVILHVNENNPIGYVEQEGYDYYFDSKGLVLEQIAVENWTPDEVETEEVVEEAAVSSSSTEEEEEPAVERQRTNPLVDLDGDGYYDTTQEGIYLYDTDGDGFPDVTTAGDELIDSDGDGIPDSYVITPTPTPEPEVEDEEENEEDASEDESVNASSEASQPREAEAVTATSAAEDSGALQAVMENTSDTEFHPALTDVARISGLTSEPLSVGMTIPVEKKEIFATIQALTKIMSKLAVPPEKIDLAKGSYDMTLHYGDVTVKIGGDDLLEEKMARVAAILPQLEGMKGTLHLENYSEETVNIVFDKE